LGQLRIDQIKRVHVNRFIEARLKEEVSPRTINLDIIALRVVLKRALEDGLIQRLPTEGMRPLKTTTRKRPLFTADDLGKLCKAASETKKDKKNKPVPVTENAEQFVDYVKFMAHSGARRNEALAMRWQDVDIDQGQLTIGAEGDTKNRSARVVDFNPKLKAHLLDMRNAKHRIQNGFSRHRSGAAKTSQRRRFVNHLTLRGFKRKCRTSLSMIAGTISFPCASCQAWIS